MANCFGKGNGIAQLRLSTCRFIQCVWRFPKLQFLLKKNCWEHEGNIELKSCISEFWSSDKGRKQVLRRHVGALFCVVSKPLFEVYRETTHRPNNSCCTASYPLHGTQTVPHIPVWCKERNSVVSILINKQTFKTCILTIIRIPLVYQLHFHICFCLEKDKTQL